MADPPKKLDALMSEVTLALAEVEDAEVRHREARSEENSASNNVRNARKRLIAAKAALDERINPKLKE